MYGDSEDGNYGTVRGGRTPGPAGLGPDAPSNVWAIGRYAPGQAPLAPPRNSAKTRPSLRCGNCEIAFYCTAWRVSEAKTAKQIQTDYAWNANGYVEMTYDVAVQPRPSASQRQDEVFQAFAFLKGITIFLPIEIKNKTAARRPPTNGGDPPTDQATWDAARARLLQHEEGHLEAAMNDMATFAFTKSELEASDLTYERFVELCEASKNGMAAVLRSSGKSWDDKDLDNCNQLLHDKGIDAPIKVKTN